MWAVLFWTLNSLLILHQFRIINLIHLSVLKISQKLDQFDKEIRASRFRWNFTIYMYNYFFSEVLCHSMCVRQHEDSSFPVWLSFFIRSTGFTKYMCEELKTIVCCKIISIRWSPCSWIVRIMLVHGDIISWVTNLFHYNARKFITLCCYIRLLWRKFVPKSNSQNPRKMIPTNNDFTVMISLCK